MVQDDDRNPTEFDMLFSSSLLDLDDEEGPARPLSEQELDSQVAAIMARVRTSAPPVSAPLNGPDVRAVGGFRRTSMRAVALWVAGSVIAGSAAALVATHPTWFGPKQPEQVTVEREKPRRVRRKPRPAAVEAVEEVESPEELTPEVKPQPRPPADLMARGNRLRAAGRYRAAVRAYLAALEADSRGATAHVAAIAAASIRLEHLHNPQGAIALFRHALRVRPGGPLALESYEGIARANRKLHRRKEEIRALRALVGLGIPGPALARAEARLEELQAGRGN